MDEREDKIPVTLMVMTYNQARFVGAAAESALSQDYDGPLEILISDDASTDGTAELLRDLVARYDGPHSVRLNVNSRNLGLMAHFRKVFAMARHDFVVCGAGDDISREDRVRLLASLQARSGAWLLYSRTHFMDVDGASLPDPNIKTTFADKWTLADAARSDGLFIGAGAAYHKNLLRAFGPILERDAYEDLVMGFRAALVGRISYCSEALVRYRVGEGLSAAGSSKVRDREHALSVWLAILRQRLIDAKGVGLTFEDPVLATLREAISEASAALSACRTQRRAASWHPSDIR
jgi:glycosyltransferase involved in cell wall biosynthesis